jgi:hypothetical protein
MGIEPMSEAWEASDLVGTGGPSAKNWILLRADKLVSLKRHWFVRISQFPLSSLRGNWGTPCMRSHITSERSNQ